MLSSQGSSLGNVEVAVAGSGFASGSPGLEAFRQPGSHVSASIDRWEGPDPIGKFEGDLFLDGKEVDRTWILIIRGRYSSRAPVELRVVGIEQVRRQQVLLARYGDGVVEGEPAAGVLAEERFASPVEIAFGIDLLQPAREVSKELTRRVPERLLRGRIRRLDRKAAEKVQTASASSRSSAIASSEGSSGRLSHSSRPSTSPLSATRRVSPRTAEPGR